MDFAKIERMLDPSCYVHMDDIGGYSQPQLWRKYGAGDTSPIGNGHSGKNAVELAEEFCPGSKDVFHAVLWKLLRIKNPSEKQLSQLAQNLSVEIQAELICLTKERCSLCDAISTLPKSQLDKLATHPHIDVLAVLLMRLQVEGDMLKQVELVALITWWLNHSVILDATTRKVAHMLLPTLEEYQPLLGSLNSFIGIKHELPAKDHWDRAFRYIIFESNFTGLQSLQ